MSTSISATEIGLPDNAKLKLGTGEDLELYHDGSHSYIDNTGTGNLYIKDAGIVRVRTASFGVDNADGSEALLSATANGAVELYHNNGIRLATTSTGINISQAGSNSFSNFSHGGGIGGVRIAGPAASSGANLTLANNFDNSVSDEWAMCLDGSNDDLVFKSEGAGGTDRIRFLDNGGICFGTDTATANALDDYEEGTWTPTESGGLTLTVYVANYIKIGRIVHIETGLLVPTNSDGGAIQFGGLPFTAVSSGDNSGGLHLTSTNSGRSDHFFALRGQTLIGVANNSNQSVARSAYSNKQVKFSGTYISAS